MSRTAAHLTVLLVLAGALSSSGLAQVAPLPVPKITWHVENSFRFFSDAADTDLGDDVAGTESHAKRQRHEFDADRT